MDSDGGRGCSSGYYSVLGVPPSASPSQIRSAYRKLAMKWHPDRWARDPAKAAEAKLRFQRIQEAYSVLCDDGKRKMYDLGLYDPLEEEEEGFSDFVGELLSMMDQGKQQPQGGCSLGELQRMFDDIVQGGEEMGFSPAPAPAPASDMAGSGGRTAKFFY